MSTEWLRQEHIDAQKKRVKLIQWKLVVVATLGATALGFTGSNAAPNSDLVLCCIPFVCCYADALIYHNGIISHVIGEFIRNMILILSSPNTKISPLRYARCKPLWGND
jgi:hypothetical protein